MDRPLRVTAPPAEFTAACDVTNPSRSIPGCSDIPFHVGVVGEQFAVGVEVHVVGVAVVAGNDAGQFILVRLFLIFRRHFSCNDAIEGIEPTNGTTHTPAAVRLAGRMLQMGDVVGLVERAQRAICNDESAAHWKDRAARAARPGRLYGRANSMQTSASERRVLELGPARTKRLREVAREPGVRSLTPDLSLFNIFATVVMALFFLGFELDERLAERLAFHKRSGVAPEEALPLGVDVEGTLAYVADAEGNAAGDAGGSGIKLTGLQLRLISIVAFFTAWEIAGRIPISPAFPTFTETIAALVEMTLDGSIFAAYFETLKPLALGVGISAVFGVAIGVSMGLNKKARWLMSTQMTGTTSTKMKTTRTRPG